MPAKVSTGPLNVWMQSRFTTVERTVVIVVFASLRVAMTAAE